CLRSHQIPTLKVSPPSSNSSADHLPLSLPKDLMAPVYNMGGYTAEVTQVSASHAPVIGKGRYFCHKEIEPERQVERIMFNIDSPEVRAWVREKEEDLKKLTFLVFMARLRGIVLSTDWAWEVAQMLSKKQGEEERFTGWVNNL
ncbi:hypothetical protein C0993_009934, partial [Termitomyces sp. T159_Od127]